MGQWVRKTSRNSSPARREASTPQPPRVGPLGEEAGFLRGPCSPVVDSSWFSGSLETTLKLSKQTPISQFFWPLYNLSLGLLYRRQGRVERRRSFAQLWCSPSSQEQQGPWHGRWGEGLSSPRVTASHWHSHPSLPKPFFILWEWQGQAPRQGDGGTVSDAAKRRTPCPALTCVSRVLMWTEKLHGSWTLVCSSEHHQYPQPSPPPLVSPHPVNVLCFPSSLASLLAAPVLHEDHPRLQDTSPIFSPAAFPSRARR